VCVLQKLINQLKRAQTLSPENIAEAVKHLTTELATVELKAEFLAALAAKGESPEEIAAFAMELRALSAQPLLDAETRAREILDVCGTGGDHLGTFNISTTVAIVCAAAGVTVAKHGNRAITSKAGSADVLEALGVKIDLPPQAAARNLREHGFAFFFAPNYHPAFKHIGPARKLCASRGQRTIFNFLGPLLNPARPTAQLIGVPSPALCEPMARVLKRIGVRRGIVVCGEVTGGKHLDEFSALGPNTIAEFHQERGFTSSALDASLFPIQPAKLDDLLGGDRGTNAEIIRKILRGEDRGPKRDAVLLNASAALFVAGSVRSMLDGWEKAARTLDSGAGWEKLESLRSD